MISIGDLMYRYTSGNPVLIGTIQGKTKKTLTVNTTGGAIPSVNDFLIYIKNNVAESYGTTGYYMQYELENDSESFVEIFGIGSILFKSNP
jgi:hypothetical protein